MTASVLVGVACIVTVVGVMVSVDVTVTTTGLVSPLDDKAREMKITGDCESDAAT